MNEPRPEAVIWHQLGYVYDEAKRWDDAESAYRESARLKESMGNISGAANSYLNLAVVMQNAGKPEDAETWYRRAMEAFRQTGEQGKQSVVVNNLADLLQNNPARLDEARKLAQEALAIKKTLDPGAASIWNTYNILAEIAEKQGEADRARECRRLSRDAQDNFAGTAHHVGRILTQFKPVIELVVAACDGDENARKQVDGAFEDWKKQNLGLANAFEALLNGDRDEEKLTEPVGYNSGAIIRAILVRLRGEDPFPNQPRNGVR